MFQSVAVLGATGSIGTSTLDVIRLHRERFQVLALSGWHQAEALGRLAQEFSPKTIVVAPGLAKTVRRVAGLTEGETVVLEGADGLVQIASAEQIDTVVTGVVGAAGLASTYAAVCAGKRVLVANKEPLVMMGPLLIRKANETGAQILPTDSEHNAVFQCLPEANQKQILGGRSLDSTPALGRQVVGITLTASGGPFLRTPTSELGRVTVKQAVKHPNWKMGSKISIDSATLMNKGLELIEACALFNLPESQVDVVVHPQSVVHSLVEFQDGSMLAQMGSADMRIPIAYSLSYPDRIVSGAKPLRLTEIARLDFDRPDIGRFPCLRLAREAARTGGNAPAILNAVNEIAVQAFQDQILGFMNIPELIERVLEACPYESITDINQVLSVDLMARRVAKEILQTKSWPKTVSGN